ncbi:MAG: adenosylcobalamin-dependent ribonucleoside-diphosphate reductase [Anaerolineales bacterium]|nr:adenosylcobalamin-dependent ribonucleoside-diphosphate reductase [Anaerolineales bacterium]
MVKEMKTRNINKELLPTPPLPKDAKKVVFSENAKEVFFRRYIRKGKDGNPVETAEETFWRVSYHVAKVEDQWQKNVLETAQKFYDLLVEKRFFPNSPTFTGAGTPLGQLAACFVLPLSDDMGKIEDGIFQTLRNAALIQQTGGGNGFSFSRLRPKGTLVKSSSGEATGPVGFLRVYDKAFGEIAQGGTRRGANMAVLRIDHPNIEDFIMCKTDEDAITNFNISVSVTDEFMNAVEKDEMWDLRFPDVSSPKYRGFNGTLEQAIKEGIPIKTYRTVRARDLFNKIVQHAHHNGEPGVLFLSAANKENPIPHLYELEATNPCGEQWLGPFENCCLGSVNLSQHVKDGEKVDWEKLKGSVILATRFLDDVVDANAYVPAVPQLKEAALRARRIGLGIMGLADLMYHLGIRYGSEEGQEFASQVIEFVRYHSMLASIELSNERGPFPAISGSIYDSKNLTWTPPEPLFPYTRDWERPEIDWAKVLTGIKQFGIRNAAQTTIAPTGTIATVAGLEGYGCEPTFALAYIRHVNDNGKDLKLTYTSPLFEKALIEAGIEGEDLNEVIKDVMEKGTCQHIERVPKKVRDVFVVSQDITAEEHVRMQAALQKFVDNSLSKTINFPQDTTVEDVANAYMLAWKLGAKGITVYVTGSRQKVVLETKSVADKKSFGTKVLEELELAEDSLIWFQKKKARPRRLRGYTYNVNTPLGKAFITINENGGDQPFEVFVSTAKAGSDTAAVSEAIGRLISYILRLASPIEPRERMQEIIRQLDGIGGGRSMGFGPNRIRSLPDGVARALIEYMDDTKEDFAGKSQSKKGNGHHHKKVKYEEAEPENLQFIIGDLCPECGEAAFVNEEGCRKCYACGYSEC